MLITQKVKSVQFELKVRQDCCFSDRSDKGNIINNLFTEKYSPSGPLIGPNSETQGDTSKAAPFIY